MRSFPLGFQFVGTYHQLAKFVSDVANLDRIVTLYDFELAPLETSSKKSTSSNNLEDKKLQLKIIAKTYRYREPSAMDQAKKDEEDEKKIIII